MLHHILHAWAIGMAFFIGRVTTDHALSRLEFWASVGLAIIWPVAVVILIALTIHEEWFA